MVSVYDEYKLRLFSYDRKFNVFYYKIIFCIVLYSVSEPFISDYIEPD